MSSWSHGHMSSSRGGGGSAGPSSSAQPNISVAGCTNGTVSSIIKGTFAPNGSNHGKPVYKKQGGDANVSVLIYFWDERDGPNFSGWWFGPKVGGDQVWAYNGNRASPVPPAAGWRVPWDGPEDPMLRLGFGTSGGAGMGPSSRGGPSSSMGMQQQRDSAAMRAQRDRDEEDNRRRREQERQRAIADQERRRREEDDRRRKQEEADRRRREADEARRAEEKRRREEEEVRRKETAAALAVRKVIQRVRIATPDNYDTLRSELEEAQQKNLEAMGSLAERVSQEAQQTLEQTQRRIDEIIRKREEEKRRREEEEKKKKEEAELVDKLLKQMKEEVEKAEAKVSEGEAKGKELEGMIAESTSEEIVAAAEAAVKVAEEIKEALNKVTDSLSSKHTDMGNTEASRGAKREVNEFYDKVTAGTKAMDAVVTAASSAKEKAAKKAAALKKIQDQKDEFAKHDSDSDGKLSRAEVAAFSKAQFDFELKDEALDKIMKSLDPVNVDKFRRLFQKVAIARSEVIARARRAEEEKRRRELEEKKQAVQSIVKEASDFLAEAETTLTQAEVDARGLARGDAELSADELKSTAEDVERVVVKARGLVDQGNAKSRAVQDACKDGGPELEGIAESQCPRLEQRSKRALERAEKVSGAVEVAKDLAVKRAYTEVDQRRTEVVVAMRPKIDEAGKGAQQFFKDACGGADAMSKEKFSDLITGLGDDFKLETDKMEKLFVHVAGEAASEISEAKFLELVRLYYKCVKGTVLSEDLPIKSKTVRKVELNEVLEALEGPAKEEGVGVQRVKCRAVNDDATGFVTVAGNQGTPFLVPGGNMFTCVKETVITDGLSVQDSKTVRRITKGEVIEVLEFAKKDADLDLKRIRGRAKTDGATGWITLCGNQGTPFLEVN